ncbi:MAG: response regulator, partial [Gammaproteobacteria bacterium]
VEDSGVGMDEATRLRSIEPFFTTKGEAGTGLGLSISGAIVKAHGGEIALRSSPGSGTTITISLPLLRAATAGTTGVETMVVDDDVRLRDLLRRYLTEQGFQVVTAESAPAMNKLWLRERYDLLVLDLMLPGEDGLSICRRLRGAGDQTPIIMLTAKGEDVDRIVGLEMGADDYLPKPFNPRELLARIRSVLRRSHAMPSNAPLENVQQMRFSGWTLDLTARHLVNPQGVVIM